MCTVVSLRSAQGPGWWRTAGITTRVMKDGNNNRVMKDGITHHGQEEAGLPPWAGGGGIINPGDERRDYQPG